MDDLLELFLIHCKIHDAIFFPYFPNFRQPHVQLDDPNREHFFFPSLQFLQMLPIFYIVILFNQFQP